MKLSPLPFGWKFHHSHDSFVLALSSSVMGLASKNHGMSEVYESFKNSSLFRYYHHFISSSPWLSRKELFFGSVFFSPHRSENGHLMPFAMPFALPRWEEPISPSSWPLSVVRNCCCAYFRRSTCSWGIKIRWHRAIFMGARLENVCYLGLSENSVPLHPMVNDHYPY